MGWQCPACKIQVEPGTGDTSKCACCNCAKTKGFLQSNYDQYGCSHCKARASPAAAPSAAATGAQQARPVNVAGSDEAEAVRLLENATAEAVRIKRDAEENARKIMQDARVQADRILGAARTDAEGVEAQTNQDREQARRDRELAADARAQADRILGAARTDAEGVAAQATQDREQARRDRELSADTRAQEDRILGAARTEARRMENEAQIRGEAGNVPPPPDGDLSQRTSVTVFFVGQLAHATDGFSNALRIGGGGFGSVYKAALPTGGAGGVVGTAYAAVKKLDPNSMQGQTEFLQEIQVLGGCRQENLLPLIGFSADQGIHDEHAGVCLVMPLMKGGSLEDRLFLDTSARRRLGRLLDVTGVAGAPVHVHEALTGIQRLSVLFGAVKGLEFLHTPDPAIFKPVIMHRDIKPSNIVLDADLHTRLADMGLARSIRPGALSVSSVTSITGTNGYMDVHYQTTGRYDVMCDAYSMGVTVLVTLTGWPAVDVLGHIVGRCEVEESAVGSIADERAQWPEAVAIELHTIGMGLVRANRARRMTVPDARARLQALVEAHLRAADAPDTVERECVLCMSAPRALRFSRCGHSALCRGCAGPFMQRARPICPYCRTPVLQQELIESDDVAREPTFVRPLRA